MSRPNDKTPGETATTGHEWDGIREYDNPMPRWWLWVFYATIAWSIGYWIAMPAWPLIGGYTKGLLGYSSRAALSAEVAQAKDAQAGLLKRIEAAGLDQIRADPGLLEFALAGGRSAFAVNCSQCHGSGGAGAKGFPNLNDDDWLWGGGLEEIHATIRHGIRFDQDADTRMSDMPRFGADGLLDAKQIRDVADFVLALSAKTLPADPAAVARGAGVYADNCAACHGDKGQGLKEFGAPRLADRLWLFGGDREAVIQTITLGRRGVMPAWGQRLDAATVKQLAVYVHALGGGQ